MKPFSKFWTLVTIEALRRKQISISLENFPVWQWDTIERFISMLSSNERSKQSWDEADGMNLHHLSIRDMQLRWSRSDLRWNDTWLKEVRSGRAGQFRVRKCEICQLDQIGFLPISNAIPQFYSFPFNLPALTILSQSGGLWEGSWVFDRSLSGLSKWNKG
jgi:hypothetical protein